MHVDDDNLVFPVATGEHSRDRFDSNLLPTAGWSHEHRSHCRLLYERKWKVPN